MKKNHLHEVKRLSEPFSSEVKYKCPVCNALVNQVDFISSFRLVDVCGQQGYEIVNLCRRCRDLELRTNPSRRQPGYDRVSGRGLVVVNDDL